MSTYAIGDIQGCKQPLESLLDRINFDPVSDKLWFAGDIVNRGPDSLASLRLIYSLRESIVVVLGNHDLHLLAVNADRERINSQDNFLDIFDAPDAEQLLNWLQHCPLAHAEGDFFLVHAGVFPSWDRKAALSYAAEVEQILRSDAHLSFYQHMYGNLPNHWSDDLSGYDRLRFITNVFTRMRFCYADHTLDMLCKKPLSRAEPGLIPWFSVPDRVKHQGYILHGHWAALEGGEPAPGIISLDTGCVWGKSLSAWCLEEKRWYSVPCQKQI